MKAEKGTDKKEVKVSYKYLRDNFTSIHLKDGDILTLINKQKDKRKIEPEMNIAVKK